MLPHVCGYCCTYKRDVGHFGGCTRRRAFELQGFHVMKITMANSWPDMRVNILVQTFWHEMIIIQILKKCAPVLPWVYLYKGVQISRASCCCILVNISYHPHSFNRWIYSLVLCNILSINHHVLMSYCFTPLDAVYELIILINLLSSGICLSFKTFRVR